MDEREKRPYEPPQVRGLGGVEAGQGAPTCNNGSSNQVGCMSGSTAGAGNATLAGCDTGNMPMV